MTGRGYLLPAGSMSRMRVHNGTIVWAVPGLGVRRAMRFNAMLRRRSMIETARDAELRPNDASVRGCREALRGSAQR
jgi:hypothetical protein